MYSKILALTLFAAALGLVLLGMRQQRLELMHEITLLFRQNRRIQQSLWDVQARTAAAVDPQKIEHAASQAGLELELSQPTTPEALDASGDLARVASYVEE